jgi:NADPH:quinone reductase-like Zn-dependent oxidoreductase
MRQIVITKSGGPEVLKIEDTADPTPGKGEVAIRVKASGINFADILARKGLYPDAPKPPCVVGYEVSGHVESVGEGVDPKMVGRPVLALTHFKGYADLVIVRSSQVSEKPEALTFEQAAAIPVNYLTAYLLLVVMGSLKAGESVLIHNAGGGVGLAALDIAKKVGAVTYGTASPGKHAFLRERGLDHAIDYRTQDWTRTLKQLTQDRGVELITDPLGGANWRKSYKALRATGRLGMFGISSVTEFRGAGKIGLLRLLAQIPWFHPLRLMNANKGVFGVNVGHLWREGQKVSECMQVILKGVEGGWVRPHVDRVFPFDRVGDAHTYIEERRNIGKVVLVP